MCIRDRANPGTFLTLPDGSRRYDYGNLNALGLPNRPQYGGRHVIAETQKNQNFFRRNVIGCLLYTSKKALLFFILVWTVLAGGQVYAQDNMVTGKVTDDGGSALPGVSVVVKGTNRGTTTDTQGCLLYTSRCV